MAGLTLLNDLVFKMVFGAEANRPLLRALLNALLGLAGEDRILALEILNPQLDKEFLAQKDVILDVKARDVRGRLFNIEVQVADQPAYVERALYYVARLFTSQLEKGEPYTRLVRTIGISLVDFVLFRDLPDLHSTYRLYDDQHARALTDVLELHFIELSKFRRDRPRELRTSFEKWLHALKFGELYESSSGGIPRELREEEGIEMALEEMRRVSASEEVREMVELRKKAQRDEATRLERAMQQGLEKGLQDGRQEGLQLGLERGREEGLERGREEGLDAGRTEALRETARRMLRAGLSADVIFQATGLRPEDVA